MSTCTKELRSKDDGKESNTEESPELMSTCTKELKPESEDLDKSTDIAPTRHLFLSLS
jgi:hypothetical protein